jgi:hypothetical protein
LFSSSLFFSFFPPHFFFHYCNSFSCHCSFVSFSSFITSCSQLRFLSSSPFFTFSCFSLLDPSTPYSLFQQYPTHLRRQILIAYFQFPIVYEQRLWKSSNI